MKILVLVSRISNTIRLPTIRLTIQCVPIFVFSNKLYILLQIKISIYEKAILTKSY